VEVKVEGIPRMAVISTKMIENNEELMADYGEVLLQTRLFFKIVHLIR
jgi:hypothetical protein